MRQLKMLRMSAPVTHRELPAGYRYAPFTGSQAEADDWLRICGDALLPDHDPQWFYNCIVWFPDLKPERDLFFVLDAAGRRVATSAAVTHGNGEGYVHMVACDPAHRGRGIGHAMLSHTLNILEARGCPYCVLTTDDHRTAAIKNYLDAGFRPVLWEDPDSDQRARWDAVIARLGYPPVAYLTEGECRLPTADS